MNLEDEKKKTGEIVGHSEKKDSKSKRINKSETRKTESEMSNTREERTEQEIRTRKQK